jgi:TatD DNase family protein
LYIDSHAHLTTGSFAEDLDSVLKRARDASVDAIVNICTDPASLKAGLELAHRYPWVHNVGATTPHDAAARGEADFTFFAEHARAGKLVAIGETGLDYHYYRDSQEAQKKWLIKYLELALECQLPVVIHCREAFQDLFSIIDSVYRLDEAKVAPGVLHCFTGTVAEAEGVLKRGWYLSLSGIITFKKSTDLREIIKHVPLDQLLVETDSPYLAPQSHRGQRNEPAFLPEVVQTISEIHGVDVEVVASKTARNARRLFNI